MSRGWERALEPACEPVACSARNKQVLTTVGARSFRGNSSFLVVDHFVDCGSVEHPHHLTRSSCSRLRKRWRDAARMRRERIQPSLSAVAMSRGTRAGFLQPAYCQWRCHGILVLAWQSPEFHGTEMSLPKPNLEKLAPCQSTSARASTPPVLCLIVFQRERERERQRECCTHRAVGCWGFVPAFGVSVSGDVATA